MEKMTNHYGLNNHTLQNKQKSDDKKPEQAGNNSSLDFSKQYEGEIDMDENYGYNISKYHGQYEEDEFYHDDDDDEDEDEDEGEHEGRG